MLEGMVGGWCCRMNGETLVQDGYSTSPRREASRVEELQRDLKSFVTGLQYFRRRPPMQWWCKQFEGAEHDVKLTLCNRKRLYNCLVTEQARQVDSI
jgi:hypothetical protein